MASIDIRIANQKFMVKGEGGAPLSEVADCVQKKIDSLLHDHPTMTPTKVALLAAVEFANQALEGKRQSDAYRANLIAKTGDILERIERELAPHGS